MDVFGPENDVFRLLMSHSRHVHYFRREHSIIRPLRQTGAKPAIELNSNYANARQWYSFLLVTLGRADEALAEMHAAREIDPLSRPILVNSLALRIFRRDYSETLPIAQQIVSLDEDKADDM